MTAERDLEPIVRGLYDHPQHRHAVDVTSEDDVGALRVSLEATVARLFGEDALWGRGVRVRVERDDASQVVTVDWRRVRPRTAAIAAKFLRLAKEYELGEGE